MDALALPSVRALVVDDVSDQVKSLIVLFQMLGVEARGASSGSECVELARTFKPHLILLDIAMPTMDGFRLADVLRLELLSPCLLVAVTGYGDERTLKRCADSHFYRHVLKPLRMNDLTSLLADARRLQSGVNVEHVLSESHASW